MDAKAYRDQGFIPYRLAAMADGRIVEMISYPFPEDDDTPQIKVRTPGDPTSVFQMKCADLTLFICTCACGSTFLPNVHTNEHISTVHCPMCTKHYVYKNQHWMSLDGHVLDLNTPFPPGPLSLMYAFSANGVQYPVVRCPVYGLILGSEQGDPALLTPREIAIAFSKLAPLYRHCDFRITLKPPQ